MKLVYFQIVFFFLFFVKVNNVDYCIKITFFTVYHKVKMLTDLGVLFTVFFLTKTVDNVALLSWLMREKKDEIHCEITLLIMYLYYLLFQDVYYLLSSKG